MASLVEKLKAVTPVEWIEIRGIKIGVKKLTIAQLKEYSEGLQDEADDYRIACSFAPFIVDENYQQAFTVDEIESILTNTELIQIIDTFKRANGVTDEVSEGNFTTTTP